jgi:hypothetical protein
MGIAMARLTIHSVDHRFSKQIRDLTSASILDENGVGGMDCAILDLSVEGARLRPSDPLALPEKCRLRLTPSLTLGCRIVHRDHRDIAVTFDA